MALTFTIPHRVRVRSSKLETLTLICMECDWKMKVGNRPDVLKLAKVVQEHLDTHTP